MPPRYAYWTLLIDRKPTAFRARDREELLPTLAQLRRTNADVVMKWFARGRLWDSPEAEREAQRHPPSAEKRGRDWRPGGAHRDPRDRFRNKKDEAPGPPWVQKPQDRGSSGSRPFGKPSSGPRGDRPRPPRAWNRKPQGPPKSWLSKPRDPARGDGRPPAGDWRNRQAKRGGWQNRSPDRGRPVPRRGDRPPKKRDDEDN